MGLLLGHDKVLEQLRKGAREGKPAHAQLFAGPEGVGKKLVAVEFACMLNCPDGGGHTDGECRTCRRIREGKHPDISLERPERSSIRVDRIRKIQDYIRFPPVEGPFKIVILDDAHLMNRQAQNALLKTLEEPPPGRLLILVSAKPTLLQFTVRSRCRLVRFAPISQKLMAPLLEEKLGLTYGEALTLAGMSGGGIGPALTMHSGNFLELREKVTTFLREPAAAGVREGLELSAWLSESKDRAVQAINIAASWLRDLLTAKLEDTEIPLLNADMLDGIRSAAHDRSEAQILAMSRAVSRAGELLDAETNINRTLIMDNLILKLVRLRGPSGDRVENADGARRAS